MLNDLDKLKSYLLSDNISLVEDKVFLIIPELKNEKKLNKKVNDIHLMCGIIH